MSQTTRALWLWRVREDPELTPMVRHVALLVGAYVDDHGEDAVPTVNGLARDAAVRRWTAILSLRTLRRTGWLERVDRLPEGDLYRLTLPTMSTTEREEIEV